MTVRYAAPGRINLIGEHTDYNGGFALPIALPQRTIATFIPGDADTDSVTAYSDHAEEPVHIALDTAPGAVSGWAAYVAGVIWSLRRSGYAVPGASWPWPPTCRSGRGCRRRRRWNARCSAR